ncbi:MAG: site-specific integrase [Prevotella sp.]|nr:site-specific integrase [Prevotella sp.]
MLLDKIIRPYFDKRDIRSITTSEIDNFILSLKKEKGQKTLNHIITVLKDIFQYAVNNNIIELNPCNRLKPFRIPLKEKGILSQEELALLFSEKNWINIWPNKMHYCINILASKSGMRLGELLALQPQDIREGLIIVSHSYNNLDGLKATKTGKTRHIPIDKKLEAMLLELYQGKQNDEFIFSTRNSQRPIDHKTVYKWFWSALEKIGINKAERDRRNISFHSYRHGVNTMLLEAGIPPETIRLIMGHSPSMTAHYSHVQVQNILSATERSDASEQNLYTPSYIRILVNIGVLLPDGKTVTKSLDDVALAMQEQNVQPTEILLRRLFLNRNGEPYSSKACRKAVISANDNK